MPLKEGSRNTSATSAVPVNGSRGQHFLYHLSGSRQGKWEEVVVEKSQSTLNMDVSMSILNILVMSRSEET